MKRDLIKLGAILLFMPLVLWGKGVSDPFTEMADELTEKTGVRGVHRIAVLEFKMVNSQGTVAGRIVQERLISAFVKKGTVSVVERDRLDEVKRELTLGMTGLLDETTTKQIGKVLGVDGLVLGSLSDSGKGNLEANARLVLVESGEILGATTRELRRTWLESDISGPTPSNSLEGWRMPNDFEPALSTFTAPGTVIYKNISPLGSKFEILQLTLVEEDRISATLDLEYILPAEYLGSSLRISYLPQQTIEMMAGHHVVRIRICMNESEFFQATSHLEIIFSTVNPKYKLNFDTTTLEIPFRRIWINPSWKREGYLLNTNPTMRIDRADPLVLSWGKGFTLYGDFARGWRNYGRYVVVGGGGLYRYLKIIEWSEDRIVVASPKSGRSPNKFVWVNPEVPNFLSVISGEAHSNIFLIKFNPEGLPKRD
ncbi:MAG: hypothetical protein IPN19_13345 [Elusimicrobia bacterium]|nr:hypothetical protein [Elusimicrobiota bacterium]